MMSMLQMERDQTQALLEQSEQREERLNRDVDELNASLQVTEQREERLIRDVNELNASLQVVTECKVNSVAFSEEFECCLALS